MFKVDAPVRMSTPGHSMSGAEGVGDAGWVTPGFAPKKKLENRLPNEGESSADPTLEADEQPDSATALTSSTAARRTLRIRSSSCPGRIEITRLFPTKPLCPPPYISETVAAPRPLRALGLRPKQFP